MKRSISLVLVALSFAALWLGPLTARAEHQRLRDGDDTKGRFDVRVVDTWGTHRRMGYEISTFRKWTPGLVWDAGFFVVNVDTFGQPRHDYYVLVRSNGRRMEGLLFRDRSTKRDYVVRKVWVWKPNARTVKFRFPWGDVRLPETRRVVRWSVVSMFSNDFCPNVCFDNVPNSGDVVTQIRPEPTPTPTPTLTESPST